MKEKHSTETPHEEGFLGVGLQARHRANYGHAFFSPPLGSYKIENRTQMMIKVSMSFIPLPPNRGVLVYYIGEHDLNLLLFKNSIGNFLSTTLPLPQNSDTRTYLGKSRERKANSDEREGEKSRSVPPIMIPPEGWIRSPIFSTEV